MTITNIMFDFGGVIYTPLNKSDVQKRRTKLAARLGFPDAVQMWQRFYTGHEWSSAKTGLMTEDEMWHTLLTPFGLESKQLQDEFVAELYRGCGLKDEMRDLIVHLNYHYHLSILSNATDRLNSLLTDELQLSMYFDVIINSSEIGVAKPDREVYVKALECLATSPQRVLFIDDQQRNTIVAEKLAIKSIVFDEISHLKSDLKGLGPLHQQ